MDSEGNKYPFLLDRFKAVFIDTIILVVLMKIIADIFSLLGPIPDMGRGIAFICIFLLYDPVLTCVFGGTLGHRFNGIQVKNEVDQDKNISFPKALLRFIVKSLLGWISLLTVSNNEKKKAIHDMVAQSVVIYRK